MKHFSVGLITEGYDPSSVGGINTWIQQLITSFPNIDFIIINLTSKSKLSHICFPSNVKKYIEISLWNYGDKIAVHDYYNNDESYKTFIDYNYRREEKLLSTKFYRYLKGKYESIYEINESLLDALKTVITTKLQEENIDIIHASNVGLAGFAGTHFKQMLRKPLIISEHGLYIKEWKLRLSSKFFPSEIEVPRHIKQLNFRKTYRHMLEINKEIVSFVYQNADMILPVTHSHIPTEISLGANPKKIQVINNGLPAPSEKNNLHEDRFEKDGIKIATLIRINPIKNLELFVDTAKILTNESNKYEFHIAGPIEDYDYFEEIISRIEYYNIENKIIFHGTVRDKNWLKDKDLMLLTSLSEGQPYAIIEALLQDLPIVSTSVGGIPDIINNNMCVVNEFSANKLANRIKYILGMNKKMKYRNKYKFGIERFRKNMEYVYTSWL